MHCIHLDLLATSCDLCCNSHLENLKAYGTHVLWMAFRMLSRFLYNQCFQLSFSWAENYIPFVANFDRKLPSFVQTFHYQLNCWNVHFSSLFSWKVCCFKPIESMLRMFMNGREMYRFPCTMWMYLFGCVILTHLSNSIQLKQFGMSQSKGKIIDKLRCKTGGMAMLIFTVRICCLQNKYRWVYTWIIFVLIGKRVRLRNHFKRIPV